MNRNITYKGNPLRLVGINLKLNSLGYNFKAVSPDTKEVSLSDLKDKIKIITSFPSLDTPVCDLQVKEFNKRATALSPDVAVLCISKDLPFAQKRFCDAYDIKNVLLLSDYKYSSFGVLYGLLIKELNLLARSILILDKNNLIRYMQIVGELTQAPDYQEALTALEAVRKTPAFPTEEQIPSHCKPCEAGTPPLAKERVDELLARLSGWIVVEDKRLSKEFKFKDFVETKYFLDLISIIAEEQGHHPTMTLSYNKLKINLSTHSAGGLTENDFIMARMIDEVL